MNLTGLEIYVTQIGFDRIGLRGCHLNKVGNLPGSKFDKREILYKGKKKVVETLLLTFGSEEEMMKFLQQLVFSKIPFTDNYKSTAYKDACKLKLAGKLDGEILAK